MQPSQFSLRGCLLLLVLVCFVPVAWATNAQISSPIDPRSWPIHPVTPTLKFGAWGYADFDYKGDYDLVSGSDDNRLTIDPEVGLAFNYYPDPDVQLYLGLEMVRFTFIDPLAGRDSSPLRLRITKLDLVLRDVIEGFFAAGGAPALRGRKRMGDG